MAELHPALEVRLEAEGIDGDAFRVTRLEGREAISELFHFDVDLVCTGGRDKTDDLAPGELATLVFVHEGATIRSIHGMVESVRQLLDQGDGYKSWRLRLRPRAARLGLVATQTIYLDKSVPDIFLQKLELVGLTEGADVALELLGGYPKLDFVLQYAETDLDLLARRAEHLGISWLFVAQAGVDQLVFVDHRGGFPALPHAPALQLSPIENVPNRIRTLMREDTMVPGLYVVQDYNYRRPDAELSGEVRIEGGDGGIVEYGAHVKTADEARALANVRAEEILCRRRIYRGTSTIPALTAGHLATIDEYGELPALPILLTAVEHRGVFPQSGVGSEPAVYENSFEAVGTNHTFRPRRVTRKPVVPSFVTGVVQGKPGAVAILDGEGRYTIQLHLETVLAESMRASHPVRMAQPFGGTGHGMHFPLRPGTEVLLGFANGDPDRPVLLSAVPNAHTGSPVTGVDPTLNRIVTKTGVAFEIGEKS